VDAVARAESELPGKETSIGAFTVLPAPAKSTAAARTSAIPEPVSLAVFGTGMLLLLRRRRS